MCFFTFHYFNACHQNQIVLDAELAFGKINYGLFFDTEKSLASDRNFAALLHGTIKHKMTINTIELV